MRWKTIQPRGYSEVEDQKITFNINVVETKISNISGFASVWFILGNHVLWHYAFIIILCALY